MEDFDLNDYRTPNYKCEASYYKMIPIMFLQNSRVQALIKKHRMRVFFRGPRPRKASLYNLKPSMTLKKHATHFSLYGQR